MAELHWFPAYVDKWLSSAAVAMMLPEQEGAYWHLLTVMWGKGKVEPSLPDDDAALAQMSRLGKRWKKLGPLVRAQFQSRDGRLYNAKLSEVWLEQTRKHDSAAARGAAGGNARKKNRSRAVAELPVSQPLATTEIESERVLVEPTALTSNSPAVAPGAEAPRSAELPVDRDVRSAGWSLIRDAIGAAIPTPAPRRRHA